MTFVVNQLIYEQDLGDDTSLKAAAIWQFDLDPQLATSEPIDYGIVAALTAFDLGALHKEDRERKLASSANQHDGNHSPQ